MTSYRVGVDVGGTFTDIVLLGSDGTIHTKKISSSVENYAQAIVEGLERGIPRDRPRRRRDRGDPPRHHGGLERDPRAQGRADRADHDQGFSRRARDPHAAHAAPVRHRLDQARAARRALPAPGGGRARQRRRCHGATARSARRRARGGRLACREGRGDRGVPASLVHEPGPRIHGSGHHPQESAASTPTPCRAKCCPRSRSTSAPRPRW